MLAGRIGETWKKKAAQGTMHRDHQNGYLAGGVPAADRGFEDGDQG